MGSASDSSFKFGGNPSAYFRKNYKNLLNNYNVKELERSYNKLSHEIATMAEKNAHEQIKAQLEINKTEAQHIKAHQQNRSTTQFIIC